MSNKGYEFEVLVDELYEKLDEIKSYLSENLDYDAYNRASRYWLAHIDGALFNRGEWLSGSMYNAKDTLDDLENSESGIESEDETFYGVDGVHEASDEDQEKDFLQLLEGSVVAHAELLSDSEAMLVTYNGDEVILSMSELSDEFDEDEKLIEFKLTDAVSDKILGSFITLLNDPKHVADMIRNKLNVDKSMIRVEEAAEPTTLRKTDLGNVILHREVAASPYSNVALIEVADGTNKGEVVVAYGWKKDEEDGSYYWTQGHYFKDDMEEAEKFLVDRYIRKKKVPDEWGNVI